jgi:hypothetical protein
MDSVRVARSLQEIRFCTIRTCVQSLERLRNITNYTLFENCNYTDAAKVIASTEVPLRTKGGMRDDTYLNVDWWGRIELWHVTIV